MGGEASSIKAKYIDVRHNYLRDVTRRGVVTAQHVRSELMLADWMTKAFDATNTSQFNAFGEA